jgi:hypothetical protein
MSLIGTAASFKREVVAHDTKCGECGGVIRSGHSMLTARNPHTGKVAKRVCSHECRLDFDDRFWQDKADKREYPNSPPLDLCDGDIDD